MSWIDIYLSDGDPRSILGADTREALSRLPRIRDLPYAYLAYRKAGLPIHTRLMFLVFDVVRNVAYRRGFHDGAALNDAGDQQ
jgi:hypothetical protein